MIDFGRNEVKEEVIEEPKEEIKEEPKHKSPLTLLKERQQKEKVKVPDFNRTELPKKEEFKKPTPKTTQNIPTFSMILNGDQGSGKSTMADLFPTPFIIDLEHGKNTDMAFYSTYEQIRELKPGNITDLKNGKVFDIIDIQQKDKEQLWNDIKYVLNWYITEGHKTHNTLVIDTAFWLRDTRTTVEKKKKGKDKLDWYEYGPITEDIQETIYDLLRDVRDLRRNIIFITHWRAKYHTFKDERGHPESHIVGRTPDVKEWLLDAVTWIVNFEKPEESGYDGKFIIYFDKAPRYQYAKIDITNKSLYEIINDLDVFDKEVEAFKHIDELENQKGLEKLIKKKS